MLSQPEDGCDRVINNFYGGVDARGATFGTSFSAPHVTDGGLRYATGKLRDAEVLATVSNYVRPSTFDEAAAWLRESHVVVLAGAPGSGRRAGAMALLREITDGLLVTLSPAVTAADLAEWDYLAHHGYLLLDGEGVDPPPDPAWALAAQRVRAAGAYLVVTTTAKPHPSSPIPVPCLVWERPPIADVLRAHLAANWPKNVVDDLVEMLVSRLPANCSLGWLAGLARLVNAGRNPKQALAEMEEASGRQVDRWFGVPRSRREMVDITAAAFLAGASERAYRSQLVLLDQIIMDHEPRGRPSRPDDRDRVRSSMADDSLVGVHYPLSQAGGHGVVAFKEHCYQRFVVSRIWEAAESWFRSAVREWLYALVTDAERLEVASGLAALARTHFDDVASAFLDPWSLGRLGWPGKVTATYALWCMCQAEATAPLALRTAISWANSGDANQRATAAIAFSGELGVSYPVDAARRLWQLMVQADDLCPVGRTALGRLFAILVDQTREAGTVLTLLDAQRARSCRAEGKGRMHSLTIEAIRATFAAQSHRTGRPAVADLVHAEPELIAVAARLWAALILHRPTRQEGLLSLLQALHALHDMRGEPAAEAWTLGRALSDVLPDDERSRLAADLSSVDQELRSGESQPPAGELVAFASGLTSSFGASSGDVWRGFR